MHKLIHILTALLAGVMLLASCGSAAEENTTEIIMQFLKDNFPKKVLEDITTHRITGEELTGEELYFERMEEMKDRLMEEFSDKDENYLDALLEDYYNSLNL